MKKIILKNITLTSISNNILVALLTGYGIISHAADRDSDKIHEYNQTVEQVMTLEKNNQYSEAAMLALASSIKISEDIGYDQIVRTTISTLNNIQQEVVTETKSGAGKFSILFGLIGGSASGSIDYTDFITANPEEVAQFPTKVRTDFSDLKNGLRSFFDEYQQELFYSKIFMAKALQLSVKIDSGSDAELKSQIKKQAQYVSKISFKGTHVINSCTTKKYLEKTNGFGISITGLLISLDLSASENHKAYAKTECSLESHQISISEMDLGYYQLRLAEKLLQENLRSFELKQTVYGKAPYYPTWSSPYFKP